MKRLLLGLFLMLPLLCRAASTQRTEARFEALEVDGVTYSNVAVKTQDERVFIRHADGIITLRLADLSGEFRHELTNAGVLGGVTSQRALPAQTSARPAQNFKPSDLNPNPSMFQRGVAASRRVYHRGPREFGDVREGARLWFIIASIAGLYVMRSTFYSRIYERSRGEISLMAWIPVLQCVPMLRAANLHLQWLLLPIFLIMGILTPAPMAHVPPALITYWCVVALLALACMALFAWWCFRICDALDRSAWIGVLLLFPVLHWIGLGLLAFLPEQRTVAQHPASQPPAQTFAGELP